MKRLKTFLSVIFVFNPQKYKLLPIIVSKTNTFSVAAAHIRRCGLSFVAELEIVALGVIAKE